MRAANMVCIVTGGAGGIGRATAKLLGRNGGKVIVADMDEKNGEEVSWVFFDFKKIIMHFKDCKIRAFFSHFEYL